MPISDLMKLAERFEAKLVAEAAKALPPEDRKVSDLTWLDERARDYIGKMGKDVDSLMNPPPFILDKDIWKKAKKAVKKHWSKYQEPYSVITHIYESMGGKIKKKHKSS